MPDREAGTTPEANEQKSGGGQVLKIVLIVGVLMLGQGVCMFVLMPGATPGQIDAADRIDEQGQQIDEKLAAANDVEVKVGDFAVTNNVAAPDVALQMSFQLHVGVPAKMTEGFAERLEQRQFRVRQIVEVVARQATYTDISDPTLDLMKRQIRKQLNEELGNEYVSHVIVSGFRTFEQ